jgi:uncharacterized glyoxalase superfamily protein PhnB
MLLDTGITRDVYPMPAFVTVVTGDLERVVGWFTRALDFVELFSMPGPDGRPSLVHLRRWRYQDVLVRRPGPGEEVPDADARPDGRLTLSFAATADELPALARRAAAHGDGSVTGPADTPWNTRDVRLAGPGGLVVVLTARRPEGARDAAFEQQVRRLAAEQGL